VRWGDRTDPSPWASAIADRVVDAAGRHRVWPRRGSWVAALLVSASALAAVLLYRYVDVGVLGPLPDMYENTWKVPGKLLSTYAEAAAVVLAGLGLLTHRKRPRDRNGRFLRTDTSSPGPDRIDRRSGAERAPGPVPRPR